MDPQNLTVAFSVWAAVVLLGAGGIIYQLKEMRKDVHELTQMMNSHIVKATGEMASQRADIETLKRINFEGSKHFGLRGP